MRAKRCRSPAADRVTAGSEARRRVKRLVLRSERGDGRFGSLGASARDGFGDKRHEFDYQLSRFSLASGAQVREVRVDGLSRGGDGFTKDRARQRLVEESPDVDD